MIDIELRPITADDIEFARVLRNANRDSFIDNREVSPEQQAVWFAALQHKPHVDFRIIWLDGVRVGTMSVTTHPDGSREIGNGTVHDDYRGRGIATAAESALADPNVRCWGTYFPDNPAAAIVMQRSGFTPIPIHRDMQSVHQHAPPSTGHP
jgi:RimJ/RimL family protein N-acetyltransferase